MKAIFGFGFFMLFLAAFAFVMLQGRQLSAPGGGGAELTGVTWRPATVGGRTIAEDSGMHIRFEVDGSIKGHAGCNSFFGALEQTSTGLAVGPLGATRMACPEEIMKRESAFLAAVQKTTDFSSSRDGTNLLGEDGEILATLVAVDEESS